MTVATAGGARAPAPTALHAFDALVDEDPRRDLLLGAARLDAGETRELVDGLAHGLASLGVGPGDRIGLFLQNDPQFVVAMLAAWRLRAICVPCNPMLRSRELGHHLADAGVTVLIALEDLHREVGADALVLAPGVRHVLSTGPTDLAAGAHVPDGGQAPPVAPNGDASVGDLLELAWAHAGRPWTAGPPTPDDVAVLTYTSGTTGPPKAAMNTHGNVAFASCAYRDVLGVVPEDRILGIAPLYHVTGLTGHIGLALHAGASIVLDHRFRPVSAARACAEHRATVTIAAITAYVAVAASAEARAIGLGTLRRAYSGGAPISPAQLATLRDGLGVDVHPVYGLTETTGPTHVCPPGTTPPVDGTSGALSVGLPVPGTTVRILGEDGSPVAVGEVGEVAVSGPQVVPGYRGQPEETARAIVDGELRTGDVGTVDADGWLYLVDRSKDLIVASGFKVWPREVEDVLYEHPDVREAAVVGVPDEYRGETVWAWVSLRPGAAVGADELVAHCRTRLAAYKYPRVVRIAAELPKTGSGKILRRTLRDEARAGVGRER